LGCYLAAMKSKHLSQLALSLTLALLSTQVQGQTVRYKGTGPRLWTATQVDSILQVKNEKVKSLGIVFTKQIKKTITRSDTTIYEYTLQGATAGVVENRGKYAAFIGKPLPAFVLPDLAGKQLDSKKLLGKPLVLNFWFTSCAPCIAEMPALNRIQAEKAGSEVVFLAFTYESKEKVQAFLQKRSFTFRHIAGAKQYCDQFTTGYPISIFVDKKGLVKNILEGMPVAYDSVTKKPSGAVDDKEFYAALKQIE
jgi:cytochrome c biogenesis protein CcmG/thiol:disulfide interchange protein DsbE